MRSRGLGDVYKRQPQRVGLDVSSRRRIVIAHPVLVQAGPLLHLAGQPSGSLQRPGPACLLYTSDAADERSSVDLGGRRILKKKNDKKQEKKKKTDAKAREHVRHESSA